MNKMREIFRWAEDKKRAVVAFNISNMETVQGITAACAKLNCPVILQVSKGARAYTSPEYLYALFSAAKKQYENENTHACPPMVLHLDHGDSFELCKSCIDSGFDSVMIDGSSLPFEQNVTLTKSVVEYARPRGVWVEGELGGIFGIEDGISNAETHYTVPAQAKEFVERTGADSLAVSIGTAHGAYKYKPGTKPKMRLDILREIHCQIPETPLVLHGASSVLPNYVKINNDCGVNILNNISGARSPEIRTIPIPPKPIGVAIPTIVCI